MDTNDFFQLFQLQQAAQEGYAVGLIWATMIGAAIGLVPLLYGAANRQLGVGFLGFVLCIVAGFFGSMFIAGPVAACALMLIAHLNAQVVRAEVAAAAQAAAQAVYRQQAQPTKPAAAPQGPLPWPPGHHEHLAEGRIRFSGLGVLLQAHSEGWQFLGKLPMAVELPADGSRVTYKLRLLSGEEFIESFSRAEDTGGPAVQPEEPPTSLPAINVIARLQALDTLKQSGALTEAEFNELKVRLLTEVRGA